MSVPDSLKTVTPYVRRAIEVEKTGDPRAYVVAYYCRTHAMEQALALSKDGRREADVQTFLIKMMNQLEESKRQHPDLSDSARSEEIVEGFAVEKLAEAEEEYLNELADKNTARRYYAAASFFEVLTAFREDKVLDEATKKQSLFAKWRATNILKALKNGERPVPTEEELSRARSQKSGGDVEEDDEDDADLLPPPAPSSTPTPRFTPPKRAGYASSSEEDEAPPSRRSASRHRAPARRQYSNDDDEVGNSGVTESQKKDALEYARFAVRALQTDDVAMARSHLESALRELNA